MAARGNIYDVNSTKPNYTIGSAEKVCDILLALCQSGAPMGVTELSKELDLTKSTVHKLLLTLEYKKLVEQDLETSKYYLSFSFILMLQSYLREDVLTAKIRPQMERLCEKFNETIHFGVYFDNGLFIVAKQEAKQSVCVTSQVGKVSNLFNTSIGKAILANLPEKERISLISEYNFPRFTEHTITDAHDYEKELEKIRKQGYAVDNQEYEEGVRCIGIPVFGLYHNLYGAVSMTGPIFRMTDDKIKMIKDELLHVKFIRKLSLQKRRCSFSKLQLMELLMSLNQMYFRRYRSHLLQP